MRLQEYAIKWRRNPGVNFALACYKDKDIFELEEMVAGKPDLDDLTTWGISAQEWTEAIDAAIQERMYE